MRSCKPGDKVTCLHAVEAYYSNYGGNPTLVFSPGMVAVVHSIMPKVRMAYCPSDPTTDRRETFIVADYTDEAGVIRRVGLNFVNAKKVR